MRPLRPKRGKLPPGLGLPCWTELTRDIELAKQHHVPAATWSAESVGYFIQAVLQGSFIFAKAKQSPEVVRENLAHLRRYLGLIFEQKLNKT
jgi:hypothetical protein